MEYNILQSLLGLPAEFNAFEILRAAFLDEETQRANPATSVVATAGPTFSRYIAQAVLPSFITLPK